MQVFISYSSKDTEVAQRLCKALEDSGSRCFIAFRDIRPGMSYAEEIINGIDSSFAVVLLLSENSNSSPHVLREIERAVSKRVPVIVYRMAEVSMSKSMEYFLCPNQWLDATPEDDFSKIIYFINELKSGNISSACVADFKEGRPVNVIAGGKGFVQGQQKQIRSRRIVLGAVFVCVAIAAVVAVILLSRGGFDAENENTVENTVVNDIISAEEITEPAVTEEVRIPAAVKVGETVTFGSYNGEEIEWRVLRISEDGAKAVLVSSYILTMKAFDAAEGGEYNEYDGKSYWGRDTEANTNLELQVLVRGSSSWEDSNIRAWLNSEREVVEYSGQAPVMKAMSEHKNGYNTERGFLNGFTDEERAAIVETEIKTAGNALSKEDIITTNDKVFLLSADELGWFDEAGISKYTVPTQAALEQDQSNWYEVWVDSYGVKEYDWWLREPVAEKASACYIVGTGYTEQVLFEANAGLEGYGIRPAVTVDLYADCFQ